ncbi:squalene synthase HpnC [Speluncibacter jeojiensis]|uniref:squalene synthase HpnC n=1 Tax=Speluncibacter jeojiensis TaxID=2710754 RepID=UPI00240FF097|nr:squalene synthase HpnC [Rhodococcus sp. D2-41]
MAGTTGRSIFVARDADRSPSPREQPGDEGLRIKARNENFPVASVLLPRAHRRHLTALYGFARTVDDIGDEAPGNRMALLDQAAHQLDRIYSGRLTPESPYRELSATIRECDLPRGPFDRLIQANRQDQVVTRYATYANLRSYCALSADPVGELVLGIFGAATPARIALSDRVCTALQLLEHAQDVGEDATAGRIYLPTEDLMRFRVDEADLLAPAATRGVRALVGFEVQRAVRLLDEGTALVASLQGFAKVAVAGYVAGGLATAEALAAAEFDVLGRDPRPGRRRTATLALGLWRGRR